MWKLIENKEYNSLRDRFSWVKDMEGVPQDVRYHAEGDVAIHTKMVVEELCKMSDYQLLDEQSKEILWAAALMHDIEKRSTTVTLSSICIILLITVASVIRFGFTNKAIDAMPVEYEEYRPIYYVQDTSGYYDTVIFTEEDSILSSY